MKRRQRKQRRTATLLVEVDEDGDVLNDWDRYPEQPTDDEIKIEANWLLVT